MALVADSAALEENVVRAGLDCNRIVAVEDDAVRNSDVRSAHIEPVCVEWKAAANRVRIDNRVTNGNLLAHYLDIPSNRLTRFVMLHGPLRSVETHQMWSSGSTSAIDWVRIPPGLAVGVDPTICDVACPNVVD